MLTWVGGRGGVGGGGGGGYGRCSKQCLVDLVGRISRNVCYVLLFRGKDVD